jgi:hypothetical protein
MTEERAPYRVWPPRPGYQSLRAMLEVQAYWRKYRPMLYADLQRRELLEQAIDEAIQRSGEAVEELIAGGTPLERAWQLVHDLWVFLPPEAGTETPRHHFPQPTALRSANSVHEWPLRSQSKPGARRALCGHGGSGEDLVSQARRRAQGSWHQRPFRYAYARPGR